MSRFVEVERIVVPESTLETSKVSFLIGEINRLLPRTHQIVLDHTVEDSKDCYTIIVNKESYCLPLHVYQRVLQHLDLLYRVQPEVYNSLKAKIKITASEGQVELPYYFDRISGVASIDLLESKRGMRVLLLGDLHIENKIASCKDNDYVCNDFNCRYYLPVFVDVVTSTSPKPVDIFFEYVYTRPGETTMSEYQYELEERKETIVDFARYFQSCLRSEKTVCKKAFPNIRFHYTDYRHSSSPVASHLTTIQEYIELALRRLSELWDAASLFGGKPNVESSEEFTSITMSLISLLNDKDYIFTLENLLVFYASLFVEPKIKKQFDNSRVPQLMAMLAKHVQQKLVEFNIEQYTSELHKLLSNFSSPQVTLELMKTDRKLVSKTVDLLDRYVAKTTYCGSFVFDIYTIARLFRVYHSDNTQAQNAIIYAGRTHTRNIKEFLLTLGLSTIFTSDLENSLCHSIINLTQPIFK
jgi:hypothetical protein